MKRVLLIVIDALSARIILPAMQRGRLPTLTRLAARGVLRESCTSVFPSITPAATASIVTGRFPSEHAIAGNFWYDRDHDSVGRVDGALLADLVSEPNAHYFLCGPVGFMAAIQTAGRLDEHGTGVVFTLPVESVAGIKQEIVRREPG